MPSPLPSLAKAQAGAPAGTCWGYLQQRAPTTPAGSHRALAWAPGWGAVGGLWAGSWVPPHLYTAFGPNAFTVCP